jgi:hypothetical protein
MEYRRLAYASHEVNERFCVEEKFGAKFPPVLTQENPTEMPIGSKDVVSANGVRTV